MTPPAAAAAAAAAAADDDDVDEDVDDDEKDVKRGFRELSVFNGLAYCKPPTEQSAFNNGLRSKNNVRIDIIRNGN